MLSRKKSASNPLGIICGFDLLTKVLGMLTFGAITVIHKSNYLSVSQIWLVLLITIQLVQLYTMKHTIRSKTAQGVQFCPRVCRFAPGSDQNGPIPYFYIFPISQGYDYICLHYVIGYTYCHSRKIPAKYYDYRLDIFNVGSIFLCYAILPRLSSMKYVVRHSIKFFTNEFGNGDIHRSVFYSFK